MSHTHFVSVHQTTCLFTILHHGMNCKLFIISSSLMCSKYLIFSRQEIHYFQKIPRFSRASLLSFFPYHFPASHHLSLVPCFFSSFSISLFCLFRSANGYNISALPHLHDIHHIINLLHKVFSHFANTSSHT